ncbi:MAG TPA: wax ester/triacylglycerol synthase family O-acyltransferase [Streptosporangiaceae bacterium]|nr:wax ester/triacylglycerol synthase family O-acyltransferase [Streptosporangiaceae bacterium]
MAQLKPLDAAFVDAEDADRNASFAIGSIAIFEGPPPAYDDFLAALSSRLPLVPLYRKKLRKVPLGLGPPVWVDDPHFDLRYHVRQTALPSPSGEEQLRTLMARVMTERLDRDYPLWEYWLVERLDRDRWALITKIHHCMVDGLGGAAMYRAILDVSPEPPSVAAIQDNPSPANPQPSPLAVTARAAVNALLLPVYDAGAVQRALAHPARSVRQATTTFRGLARYATALPPAAKSSLSGPIGRQRRFTWVGASLDDVKAIKNALGGTVNDVFLAAITGGFRELLLARGEVPTRATVPSLVPVSVRRPGEEGVYENRVSALVTNLPVHIPDPAECLTTVASQLAALKSSSESEAGEAFVGLRRYTPFALASLFVRAVFSIPQREIVTVTTSVPGPQQPLYALGRRLLEIIPYVPIATTLRTGVCIFTYNGQVTFGITGDYDSTPDLDVLARGIDGSIARLLTAAKRRRGKRR